MKTVVDVRGSIAPPRRAITILALIVQIGASTVYICHRIEHFVLLLFRGLRGEGVRLAFLHPR